MIILLILAAIVVVWQVVQGTIRGGTEQIGGQTECLGLNIEITNKLTKDSIEIIVRSSKDIDGYRLFMDGEEMGVGKENVKVLALNTDKVEDIDLRQAKEIEVIGKIEGWCGISNKESVEPFPIKECEENEDCDDENWRYICDVSNNACVECLEDGDCDISEQCIKNMCNIKWK